MLFPGTAEAATAAKAGYPSVPASSAECATDKETPDYSYGALFTGRAWSEPTLLRPAYAFGQWLRCAACFRVSWRSIAPAP